MNNMTEKEFDQCLADPSKILQQILDNLQSAPVKIQHIVPEFHHKDWEIVSKDWRPQNYQKLLGLFSKFADFEFTYPALRDPEYEYYLIESTNPKSDFQLEINGNCVQFGIFCFFYKGDIGLERFLQDIIKPHRTLVAPRSWENDIKRKMWEQSISVGGY